MSVASEYRGGGWVKCCVGIRACRSSGCPAASARQELVFLLARRGEDAAVAVEFQDLPLRLEEALARLDFDVRDGEDGRVHLARDEPAVDQLVELELVDREAVADPLGGQAEVGRPYRLVRLLRGLARGVLERLGGQIAVAVLVLDQFPDALERLLRDAEAVRPHVGDQADRPGPVHVDPLVQLLGDHHRPLAGEPEPDRPLLLEGARLERRIGLVLLLRLLDPGDRVGRRRQGVVHGAGVDLVPGLELLAFPLGQGRLKAVGFGPRARRADRRGDPPVFLRDERPDLLLAVGDQPDRDRLHPPGAQVPGDLAPQQGADLVTHEPVEEPPRLLRVDQVHVDRADVLERLLDGAVGDLVERDPAHPLVGESQGHLEVPGDGFPLAVGVGREVDDVGLGGLLLQFGDGRLLLVGDEISGLVAVRHVDADVPALFGEVADVPHARLDHVTRTEELVDRLGLLGAFDDDQRLARAAALPCGGKGRLFPRGLGLRLGLGLERRLGLGGTFGGLGVGGITTASGRRLGGLTSHGVFLSPCHQTVSVAGPGRPVVRNGLTDGLDCGCPGAESWYTTVWAGHANLSPFK